jgi:N-acetylglucosamine kinase-like BadF-type ATPase
VSLFPVTSSLKIGVDGGGTKTGCILVDATGAVVAEHAAPGCNPNVAGPDRARAVLNEALQTLTRAHPGPVTACLLCMSGSRDFWRETAAGLTGFGRVVAVDDSYPVLELATDGAPGLVVHAGTGSFVAARAPNGAVHYAGGVGWRFGDPGSGYDLGRRAIAHALLELQGWPAIAASPARGVPTPPATAATPSPLLAALQTHAGVTEYNALSRRLYQDAAANGTIAAFAPRVLELAEQGEPSAVQALGESLVDLATLVDRVLARLFSSSPGAPAAERIPIGVSGGILNSPPAAAALRTLAETRRWPGTLRFITAPPIEGVRKLVNRM